MKITIVVPVYNVEPYLDKCILSIRNQTYQNLEIILVNDGSPDKSPEICERHALEDSRIRVLHKTNGGLSSARNAGIDVATGELINFIDSDDWVEPDFIEILHKGIVDYEADISVVYSVKVWDFENINFLTKTSLDYAVYSRDEAMKVLFTGNEIGHSAANKLYKIELFKGIRFPLGMMNEDKATTYKLIHKSKTITVNPSQKYHYYLRVGSIVRSDFGAKNFDTLVIHREIIDFIKNKYPKLLDIVLAQYGNTATYLILVMIRSNHQVKQDFQETVEIMKESRNFVYKEKIIRPVVKFLTFFFTVFPGSAYILAKSKLVSKILMKTKLI